MSSLAKQSSLIQTSYVYVPSDSSLVRPFCFLIGPPASSCCIPCGTPKLAVDYLQNDAIQVCGFHLAGDCLCRCACAVGRQQALHVGGAQLHIHPRHNARHPCTLQMKVQTCCSGQCRKAPPSEGSDVTFPHHSPGKWTWCRCLHANFVVPVVHCAVLRFHRSWQTSWQLSSLPTHAVWQR